MQIKNFVTDSIENFFRALANSISDKFKPNLAIVFSHSSLPNHLIAQSLQKHNIDFIGCSSAGEIVNGKLYNKAITITLFELERNKYRIYKTNVTAEESYQTGIATAAFAKEQFNNPKFVSLFTLTIDAEQLVEGLKVGLNNGSPIYGGIAADDQKLQPYLITADKQNKQNFQSIIFDNDAIELHSTAISGWEPIGIEYTITKSNNNIVYEINNEPALDFFVDFFGFRTDPLNQVENTEASNIVNTQYPIQISKENRSVIRSPLDVNTEDKSITLAGPVNTGDVFKFSVAPGFKVIEETIHGFQNFKKEVNTPEALILFSCKARHYAFGPVIEDEIEAIHQLWDVPFQGFLSFGEIGNNKNEETYFHNSTCCLLTIKEKQS